jgi:hypothetical protein
VFAQPFDAGELGVGLDRTGFIGGDGVAVMTGIWTHFGHKTSLPVKVTRSPDGNGCLCKTTPGKSKNQDGVSSKMIHSKTLEIIDISKKAFKSKTEFFLCLFRPCYQENQQRARPT